MGFSSSIRGNMVDVRDSSLVSGINVRVQL